MNAQRKKGFSKEKTSKMQERSELKPLEKGQNMKSSNELNPQLDLLNSEMLSRIGKCCHEDVKLVDRAQKSLSDKKEKIYVKDPALLGGRNVRKKEGELDVRGIFTYYKEILHKPDEAEEKKKTQDFGVHDASMFSENTTKKTADLKCDAPSASFKTTKRKPLYYERKGNKKPPIGHYYPHYNLVTHSSPAYKQSKSKKVSFFDKIALNYLENTSQTSAFSPPLPQNMTGTLCFSGQTCRNDKMFFGKCNPHEARFENFNRDPKISTTYQHPRGFDLKKTTGHQKQLFSSTLTNIQYSPKTILTSERIGRGIVLFSKMPKRNFDFGLGFNKYHDSVDRKTLEKFYANPQRSVPNFQRQRTTMDKDSSLPRFLQGIHNRMGVGILSPQSLKANNYQNARFLSNTSSFSNLSKQPTSMHTIKRKRKFEDDLEISQSLDESSCVMVDMKEEEESR